MLLIVALALLPATAQAKLKEIAPVLLTPDRVESFEVRQLDSVKFTILPEAQRVPPAVASELAKILLDPKSYDEGGKACGFQPGVAFRFSKGSKAIDVLICFRCNDVVIRPANSEGWGWVGKSSMDRLASRVLELTKTARPDDLRLKDLK